LHGIPGEEFPALPQPDPGAATLSLPVDTLTQLIGCTYFSISTDETRLHLNSALFEWDGDRVRMVTTDGHRLSKAELTVPGQTTSANMLIPLKGVLELKGFTEEAKARLPDGERDYEHARALPQRSNASSSWQAFLSA
jgi:DNA polymerase-3 subunit beta